jgi:hypothetical protein
MGDVAQGRRGDRAKRRMEAFLYAPVKRTKDPLLSATAQKKPATPKKLEVAGLIFLSRFTATTQNRCGPMTAYWAVVKEANAGFADPPLALKPQTKTL